jgi:putative sterol carrier protein
MSATIDEAVAQLGARAAGKGYDGTAKFVLTGEGSIILDADGARASDEEADVTLTASPDTFRSIMTGDLDPTVAFMTGRLSVDGDMGQAMRLAQVLS